MRLLINSFIGSLLLFIFYIFNFNIEQIGIYVNNLLLSQINIKIMIHNYLLKIFNKSLSTNALLYIIIFSCEILFFSFYGGQYTDNYFNKVPFYILFLTLIDFLFMYFKFNLINLIKSNICFLLVETYFGHIFNIYELLGMLINILISYMINI